MQDGGVCVPTSVQVDAEGQAKDVRYPRPAGGMPWIGFDSHESVTARLSARSKEAVAGHTEVEEQNVLGVSLAYLGVSCSQTIA
jgi:hypothetical protein